MQRDRLLGLLITNLGGEGSDTDSHFGHITNLLLIHFWINYHLLELLIDFIINHY